MSSTSKTIAMPSVELRIRLSNLRLIGAAAKVRVARFLLALIPSAGLRDHPGVSVLREFGLEDGGSGHGFDFADIHHGIESARMRALETSQAWRGS